MDYYLSFCRGVAQPGSVPEWGSGGRWFKSSRPDQPFIKEIQHYATSCERDKAGLISSL